MHVVLISACEKRALKKTRAVLDSYALRTGPQTWTTPITQEGLEELKGALNRTATRQTAVACYRNEGYRRMKLIWIIGSKKEFGPNGHFPCGSFEPKKRIHLPEWIRVGSLLARAAGYAHDLGKGSKRFQTKLIEANSGKKIQKDEIRHEWISLKLLHKLRDDLSWSRAWSALSETKFRNGIPLSSGMTNVQEAIDFLVVTHHRLLESSGPNLNEKDHVFNIHPSPAQINCAEEIEKRILEKYRKTEERLKRLAPNKSSSYWRALAVLARSALIFADHTVSAIETKETAALLFANTRTGASGKSMLNQKLEWHLDQVGVDAGTVFQRMATLKLPSLKSESIENIINKEASGKFAWQNVATAELSHLRAKTENPFLVLNLAGTGSGKTLMNAKAACVIANRSVRFVYALNLRALTLQTGKSIEEQLNIAPDELATVIGDKIVEKLFNMSSNTDSIVDEDENLKEPQFACTENTYELPSWINSFIKKNPELKTIIGSPILVSTIDYIIAAGELDKQGHHVSALMRLLDSDLILDEIDGYDPKPLAAVLRIIQIAALCGRNVVCSSATLSIEVADAVNSAFKSGIELRQSLTSDSSLSYAIAIIDNLLRPKILQQTENFRAEYSFRCNELCKELEKLPSYRKPEVWPIQNETELSWMNAVIKACRYFHEKNQWSFADTNKLISFGLVRVANIKTAIKLARSLSEELSEAFVATYHANDFLIQRYKKELVLDQILSRKKGNSNIELNPEINKIVRSSVHNSIIFILVATPVEEIGRDHDFDWAIIEPSSSQSIVQTAGRVNRHRLIEVSQPNIALLQYNFRHCKNMENGDPYKAAFIWPGFESEGNFYESHDLNSLLQMSDLPAVDARLRFGKHPFSQKDDESIRNTLKPAVEVLENLDGSNKKWMGKKYYRDYALRNQDDKESWFLSIGDEEDQIFKRYERTLRGITAFKRNSLVQKISGRKNSWLSMSIEEMVELCESCGISPDEGLSFEISVYNKGANSDKQLIYDESFGFMYE